MKAEPNAKNPGRQAKLTDSKLFHMFTGITSESSYIRKLFAGEWKAVSRSRSPGQRQMGHSLFADGALCKVGNVHLSTKQTYSLSRKRRLTFESCLYIGRSWNQAV